MGTDRPRLEQSTGRARVQPPLKGQKGQVTGTELAEVEVPHSRSLSSHSSIAVSVCPSGLGRSQISRSLGVPHGLRKRGPAPSCRIKAVQRADFSVLCPLWSSARFS